MSDKKDPKQDQKPEPVEAAAKKVYVTSKPINIEFDILIKGETLMGYKGEKAGHVYFDVPAELDEWFQKHYHFQVGNVVAA